MPSFFVDSTNPTTMTKEDVLRRLCALQSEVNDHLGSRHAADCFCGESKLVGYSNEGEALEYIEAAVRDKIREKTT